MYDLVIQGRMLKDGSLLNVYLLIDDGIIGDIKMLEPSVGEYGEIHRHHDRILIPGAIDLHTHMREPGMEHKEDFGSGTISAAFGGVTAIVDMPNTKPPTKDAGTFIEKKNQALSKAHVDVGLNLVLHDGTSLEKYPAIFSDPALAGFKVFMGETTGSLVMKDLTNLNRIFETDVDERYPVSVHAEDGDMMAPLKIGRDGLLSSHLASRPDIAESSAISKIISTFNTQEKRIHILHVSSEKGLETAASSQATVETTPHHLLLDIKNFSRFHEIEGFGKVNPPIRTPRDRAALWDGIRSGKIDTIGSDHAPHTVKEKEMELPPSGMPGVETMVPLMLHKVRERELELARLISLLSTTPARRLGLDRRGVIEEGMMADVLVIDMKDTRKIRGDDLHSRCGWSAFEGMEGIFPIRTYGRGELLVEDDSLCSKGGRGRPIRQ